MVRLSVYVYMCMLLQVCLSALARGMQQLGARDHTPQVGVRLQRGGMLMALSVPLRAPWLTLP